MSDNSPNSAQKLKIYADCLKFANVENPWKEARLLVAHVLDIPYILTISENFYISNEQHLEIISLIHRREKKEPLSKIIEEVNFWNLSFKTTKGTLDPRPESELFIETVLSLFEDKTSDLSFLDLGTGTGCLLLSCLFEYPNATGLGVDISEEAVVVAKQNAVRLSLRDRASFIVSDWNRSVTGQFDVILCNPPYIKTGEFLDDSVLFDPHIALFAGRDGLDCYREIFKGLHTNLKRMGGAVPAFGERIRSKSFKICSKILVEIGLGQREEVEALAKATGFRLLKVVHDLQKIPRILVFEEEIHIK